MLNTVPFTDLLYSALLRFQTEDAPEVWIQTLFQCMIGLCGHSVLIKPPSKYRIADSQFDYTGVELS